jgi:hypothetical protein
MNQLETKLVEYCATAKRLAVFQNTRFFRKDSEVLRHMIEEDCMREDLQKLESEIDSEFEFAVATARDWGEISGIPDMAMDIVLRASESNAAISRGVSVRNPHHSLVSLGKLIEWAVSAAQRHSTSSGEARKSIGAQLQIIYLSLGDLVSHEWQRRKR